MRRLLLALPLAASLACAGRTPAPSSGKDKAADPHAAARLPEEVLTEYDLDHDGKPDVWRYSRKGPDGKEVLVRRERDLNGDGKVDVWEYYDANGNLDRQVIDLDFDGKPDVVIRYEKGQIVSKEMSLGFDGKPHTWLYYEKGKLVRKERDENGDGKVDYWEYWEGGEIDRIGIDVDGDGKVDRWESRKTASEASPAR